MLLRIWELFAALLAFNMFILALEKTGLKKSK